MVLLAFLATTALSIPEARVCLYDFLNTSCPADSTERLSVFDWAAWHAREEVGFGLTGNSSIIISIAGNVPLETPISLHLDYSFVHNVTFIGVNPFGGQRVVAIDQTTVAAGTNTRFVNCFIVVDGGEIVRFANLILENSTFYETSERVFALHSLTVDLQSADAIDYLTADRVTLNFEKSFWPRLSSVIRIGKLLPVRRVIVGGIDHALTLHIFGDLFVFQRQGYTATVYFDVTESITPPRVELDKTGGQLSVLCDYYVPKYYDPPIVEFRLETNEPLIFEDSPWPIWFPNLVLVTTRGRAGQNLWIRTPRMPVTIKTWYNISDRWKPTGDANLKDGYLTELTIYADLPNVEILGQIQTQASDLHFDTHLKVPVNVTVFDLSEYGMIVPGFPALDKGVFPHIQNHDMIVKFYAHEKHETLNTSSKFGGAGRWEWVYDFPYTQASTGVGNLLVESDRVYSLFYGHNHTYGTLNAPLAELSPFTEQNSTITFTDPAHRVLRVRPLYYFQEFNRPSDNEIDAIWPDGKDPSQISGYPALIYFRDVHEDFRVEIDLPDTGASGFEPSTYFFNFVWDAPTKSIRMVKNQPKVGTFNYKFCYLGAAGVQTQCPAGYATFHDYPEIKSHVKPIAKQLRFAILEAFDFCPIFDYFTNTSIDVSVFAPHPGTTRPNFTVPIEFLHGTKFGETHLFNLTLKFNETKAQSTVLSDVVHLDLHNVSLDPSVHNSLALRGCQNTPRLEADPYSYHELYDRCVPEVLFLDEGRFDQITFGTDRITLGHSTEIQGGQLDLTLHDGRPYFIEIIYHQLNLRLDVATGTTRIPQTLIFQPDIPGQPNYTFNNRWTPALAGNLTIDNLLGYFYINTPFIPFRPGRLIRIPETGQSGIRIHGPGTEDHSYPDGVRVYYPFPDYARINPAGWGEVLRYQDITLYEPMSLDGDIERAIFAGKINFSLGAGIYVHEAVFDPHNRTTLNIEYQLQGGLPRIYLGTSHCPMDLPEAVNLIHRGASEKAFIQRHPDWFRLFSHEIVCANQSLPCDRWPIHFLRNATEDPSNDHVTGSSILRAVCRQENEGVGRTCLAIEIDPYYFPYPSPSPAATPSPWQTFPPPRTFPPARSILPSHTPFSSLYVPRTQPGTPGRSLIRTRSPPGGGGGVPAATGDNAGAAPTAVPGGLGVGGGVGIGIAVGVVIAAVAGALVYFLVIRPKTAREGYDNVDLDAKTGVSL